MFFDVLMIVIIVVCAFFGFRNGFLISLSRIGGWLGALIVAFLFHNRVGDWLVEHTTFYDRTHTRVKIVCDAFVTNYTDAGDPSAGAGGFESTLDQVGKALSEAAASQITAHLWTVLVFVGVIFAIKLALFVLTLLLSKRFHGGMIGGIDGVAGLLFGLFQAIAAILVVFALLLPISYMVSDKTHAEMERSLKESMVAEMVYENNPLLDLIDGFLPTSLTPAKWLTPDNYQNVLNGSGNDAPRRNNADDLNLLLGLVGKGEEAGGEETSGEEASGEETASE